ncbi:DNA (cytosine-5-)-methyltransferase [Spiroplasma endosymbiont of Labia minor]|uniref:DNA (cytosine-5-)-methyltransferase n=1 Tax=Spiroplasma endosymbiont of Labia minor TaxID=3066305 RepID=UPI0030D06EF4
MKEINIVELFAGVGGFRLGLERANKKIFKTIFVNQWEPNKKSQYAFDCYINNFGSENTTNYDIAQAKNEVPKNADLLVGGFPCQDYSVASTNAKGIEGKKGVLWWEISWILKHKKPKMILLENVDRLLKSPSNQRGRDFAIILLNLHKLGYDVEWQVINGADYGMVQRRKRVFIFATKRTEFNNANTEVNLKNFNFKQSIFTEAFPIENTNDNDTIELSKYFKDEYDITKNYNKGKFKNRGYMLNGVVYQTNFIATYNGGFECLEDILEINPDIKYKLTKEQKNKFEYLKGPKKIERHKPNGELYYYSEGKMNLFDLKNKASRTMLTSEGTINRSSHIIKNNNYRFITPVEAERLNYFPDNWTKSIKLERMRYFVMGNALIVKIIEILGKEIIKYVNKFLLVEKYDSNQKNTLIINFTN